MRPKYGRINTYSVVYPRIPATQRQTDEGLAFSAHRPV